MDFLLTQAQRTFRRDARAWLEENMPAEWRNGYFHQHPAEDERGAALRAWEQKVHVAGYAGLHWPKDYGGHGLTLVEHFIWGEEVGRTGAPEGINPIGRELVGGVLLHAGTEDQKHHYLPRIAACTDIWCQGFSEPNAGSDLLSMKTRGVQTAGGWLINGQKIWTSYGQHADMCLLLARTSDEPKKSKGLTMFAMPMSAPGITRRGIQQLDGTWDFNQLFFDDVLIPDEHVIGGLGEGWAASNAVLAIERATTRLYRQQRYLNELRHAYGIVAARGRTGETSDRLRKLVAEAYSKLLVLRALNVHFVGRIVAGERVGSEASISKQCWSIFHQDVTSTIAEMLGSDHWFPDDADGLDAGRFMPTYFHSRAETILAGTSEVQRDIIAERLLDLPRSR